MADRTRVGVIGCGLIAQVMHLPYLSELSDRFELAALCDLRPGVAAACAERYGVATVSTRCEDLLATPLDAVLIATSGDHAPIAIEAARAGLHVLVEKPMALSSAGAERMVQAAREAGVCLMVGTMKRYDPAYERLAELLPAVEDVRLIRVTTLESPFQPYVAHYPLVGIDGDAPAPDLGLDEHEREALDAALGDVDEQTRWCYRWILLDNLVHELNMLQGLLGEPDEIRFVHLSPRSVGIDMRFGQADCRLAWVDLPGIARYKQELCFYAPAQRLTLELPSPFLRSMPTRLVVEGGAPESGGAPKNGGAPGSDGAPMSEGATGSVGAAKSGGATDGAHSWEREEITSFDEAFKRELVEFSECIRTGRQPRTSGADGLRDMRLAEALARSHAAHAAPAGVP